MSNFMIACVLLNISKNNSGLKGLMNIRTYIYIHYYVHIRKYKD